MHSNKHSLQSTFSKSVLLLLDLLSLQAALYPAWQLRKSLNVGGALPAGVDLPLVVYMSAGLMWILTSFLVRFYRRDDLQAPATSTRLAIMAFVLNGLAVYRVSQHLSTVVPRSVFVVYARLGSGFFFLPRRILTTNHLKSMRVTLKRWANKIYQLDRQLSDRKLGVYNVGALGLVWCMLVFQAGMGISPDSVNYIQPAAKSPNENRLLRFVPRR